jgi:hypothetical protein
VGRSGAELISKFEGASQDLEESMYWSELLGDSETMNPDRLGDLQQEAAN